MFYKIEVTVKKFLNIVARLPNQNYSKGGEKLFLGICD